MIRQWVFGFLYTIKNSFYFQLLGVFSFINEICCGQGDKRWKMSSSVFIIYAKGEGLTFQMYARAKVKLNDNKDYRKQRQKGLELPKLTCIIGKMKHENENTIDNII